MLVKEKKQVFKVKDISNDGVIKKVKDFAEPIKIKTEKEKYAQNKKFIRTNEIKENSYKEKIVDVKKTVAKNLVTPLYNNEERFVEGNRTISRNFVNPLYENKESVVEEKRTITKNRVNPLNDNKEDLKYNISEDDKKGKKKNNRRSLSSRVLKGSEYTIDQLLSVDDEDLGVDTIIKTKAGAKASARLTKKNYEVSKRIGKKAYKIATSEKAKSFYAGTIKTTQKAYEKTKDISTKVYVKQKVNSYLKANSLKERQKREIKKQMNQKAKEKFGQATYMVASKVKDVLVSLFTKKVAVIGLIIIALIVTLISAIVGITSLFAYSVNLSLDDNLTIITEYISELDYNINSKIDKAPQNYPYVDNFIYNVPQRAETNEEQIYAYLKAKYGDEKVSETVIKGEIEQIHNKLYRLSLNEKINTWTETKEDGSVETHTTTIMTITLVTKTFTEFYEENKDSLLKKHQQKDYENILKLMKENVGKILNNPFPKVDWRKYITSEYGYRLHPITGVFSKHTGLDIGMSNGTNIYACMSGTVQTFNSGNSGFGLYLTITNGKYKTLYAHCSEILVQEGQRVNAGDIIAKVGNTGNSTGPHLHLEYFVNGTRKNPKSYLKIYEE